MDCLITPADRIFVAGHRGMAGSAICRALQREGYSNLLTASRAELDLEDGPAVQRWFSEHMPTVVVLAAAKVGGIQANNSYPADFLLDNLKIQTNVIETAWRSGVRRLLFLGSSSIYPKFAEQPIRSALYAIHQELHGKAWAEGVELVPVWPMWPIGRGWRCCCAAVALRWWGRWRIHPPFRGRTRILVRSVRRGRDTAGISV
jgi:nucleoside-diphosphate-sugar epimerase